MKKDNEKSFIAFYIPIIILTVSAVILALSFIGVYNENKNTYTYKPDHMYRDISDGKYSRAYEYYCKVKSANKDSEQYKEAAAIADYWHASFMYFGLKEHKDTTRYEKIREESAKNAGEFSFKIRDIDQLFE